MRSLYDITFRISLTALPDVLKAMHDNRADFVGMAPCQNGDAQEQPKPRERPARGNYAARGSNTPGALKPASKTLARNYIASHPGAKEPQVNKYLVEHGYSKNTTGARLAELCGEGVIWRAGDGAYYLSEHFTQQTLTLPMK